MLNCAARRAARYWCGRHSPPLPCARGGAEAKQVVRDIAARQAVLYVVKSKSMARGIGD